MALRITVTIEAKAHTQMHGAVDTRHRRDITVAGGARDALMNVHSVVEVHEVWNARDAFPDQRTLALPTVSQRREQRTFGMNLRVTTHAQRRVGQTRVRASLSIEVTIGAVDAVVLNMVPMIKLDRL